jgi:hypothetical protein
MTNQYTTGEYLEKNPDWHEGDSAWKATQIKKMLDRNQLTSETVTEVGFWVAIP